MQKNYMTIQDLIKKWKDRVENIKELEVEQLDKGQLKSAEYFEGAANGILTCIKDLNTYDNNPTDFDS